MSETKKGDSPNPKIDKAIEKMLKDLDSSEMMPEIRLKTIQVAINWEKAKHAIRGDEEFDPDAIG